MKKIKKTMKLVLSNFIPAMLAVICHIAIFQQTLIFTDYVKNNQPDIFYGNEGIVILCSFLSCIWLMDTIAKPYISAMQKPVMEDLEQDVRHIYEEEKK